MGLLLAADLGLLPCHFLILHTVFGGLSGVSELRLGDILAKLRLAWLYSLPSQVGRFSWASCLTPVTMPGSLMLNE